MLQEINAFDHYFIATVQSLQTPLMDSFMEGISFIGNPIFWILVAALIYWVGKEDLVIGFVLVF